ncbi:hypothetical protein Gogos_022315, partial [Gossypium gossypioides]|nr:hypothetical protein [Gossypium gossypioides]
FRTPYEDLAIRPVIPDEYFQNLNAWHVKVALVNYATMEIHQSDRVLRQFGFRQSIPVALESYYIQMWEDRYDYIHTREPIIVPELACVPEYIPWFRIHRKPYLLSAEERHRKLRVQREQRGPLNPRRRNDDASPSTRSRQSLGPSSTPIQSPGPATAPTQSPDPVVQPTKPTAQPFQMMPGAYPSYFMYPNPYMFPFSSPMAGWSPWPGLSPFSITSSGSSMYRSASHEGSQEGSSGSSSFYQSPSPYRFQTASPLVMQIPPQSLFYQGGSSSQHRQPDPIPEEPEPLPEQLQPLPEAGQRRNPVRNHRRPPCGTESG